MRRTVRIGGIATIASLLALAALTIFGRPTLEMKVRNFPITGGPDRKYYRATLANWTVQPITLDAIRNAADEAGGGTFFPCEIAARDQATGRWSTIARGTLAEEGRSDSDQTLTIIPLEKKYVCDIVLPHDGEPPIDCVRMTLHTHWQTYTAQADEVASGVITVPDAKTSTTDPCQN